MSRKIAAFRAIMQKPLVRSDFLLFIPRIAQASILAQSTTFPTEALQSVKVARRGQEIELPTRFKVEGDWSFTIPDSTFTLVRQNLLTVMYKQALFDVYLFLGNPTDALAPSASLSGMLSLAASAASVLLSAEVLHKCWIRSIAPVQLNANAPADAVSWQVTVHYNYIQPLLGLL